MTPRLAITFAGALLLAAPAGHAAAQQSRDIARAVAAAAPDAAVRFTFDARPEVCGDGEHIRMRRNGGDVVTEFSRGRRSGNADGPCTEGPVEVTLHRSGGSITDVDVRVGGTAAQADVQVGHVSAAGAVDWLLARESLSTAGKRGADRMVFAAALANAESWPGMLRIARDRDANAEARKPAVFWLAQAAGDRATAGLAAVAGDRSDDIEVRKAAIFALSQIRSDNSVDRLIEIARTHREPEIRRTAIFWLGQSGSPRAIAFFEEVLKG